jgi:hypothetical protein
MIVNDLLDLFMAWWGVVVAYVVIQAFRAGGW